MLNANTAMCWDHDNANAWVNVCNEIYYEASIADTVVEFFRMQDNYEGVVDLCKNHCYLRYDEDIVIDRDDNTYAVSATNDGIDYVWKRTCCFVSLLLLKAYTT